MYNEKYSIVHWRADAGPIKAVFRSSIPPSTKQSYQMLTPLTKLSGSMHVWQTHIDQLLKKKTSKKL